MIHKALKKIMRLLLVLCKYILPKGALPVLAGPLRGKCLPAETVAISPRILWGSYEKNLVTTVMNHVSSGSIIYDVGAHHGFWALLFAERLGPNGNCYAFEPSSQELGLLKKTIQINKLGSIINPVGFAVSDVDGPLQFSSGSTSYTGMLTTSRQYKAGGEHLFVQVTSITLDQFVFVGKHEAPSLIKIDVEGAESMVLLGSSKILQSVRPVLFIELHGPQAAADTLAVLSKYNYKCHLVNSDGRTLQVDGNNLPRFHKGSWTAHILCAPT